MALAFEEYQALERNGRGKDLEALCASLRARSKAALRAGGATNREGLLAARASVDAEYEIRKVFMELIDVDVRVALAAPVTSHIAKPVLRHRKRAGQSRVTRADQYRDAWMLGGEPVVDIFTLNNDLVAETIGTQLSMPVADGFTEGGSLDFPGWRCFTAARSGVRLYKLHGSINWRRNAQQILRQRTSGLRALLARGNAASEAWNVPLVWPGVYEEMPELDDLRAKFLTEAVSEARCLVIAGYRMKDPIIRECVTTGVKRWPVPTKRRVIVVCGGDYSDSSDPGRESDLQRWIAQWPVGIVIETRSAFAPHGAAASGYFPDIVGNARFREVVLDAIASSD